MLKLEVLTDSTFFRSHEDYQDSADKENFEKFYEFFRLIYFGILCGWSLLYFILFYF